jgi:hypothetical protein
MDPYLDILPTEPDSDNIPFREPTVGSVTAQLYVNPRLNDDAALAVLEELLDGEKEKVDSVGGSREDAEDYYASLVDSVEKRVSEYCTVCNRTG